MITTSLGLRLKTPQACFQGFQNGLFCFGCPGLTTLLSFCPKTRFGPMWHVATPQWSRALPACLPDVGALQLFCINILNMLCGLPQMYAPLQCQPPTGPGQVQLKFDTKLLTISRNKVQSIHIPPQHLHYAMHGEHSTLGMKTCLVMFVSIFRDHPSHRETSLLCGWWGVSPLSKGPLQQCPSNWLAILSTSLHRAWNARDCSNHTTFSIEYQTDSAAQ